MSSWVAPSVAAEIWGMSVDEVLAGIADGSIHSCVDGQFLFVDLQGLGLSQLSDSPQSEEPAVAESVVTEEEFAALTFQPISKISEFMPAGEEISHSEMLEEDNPEEHGNGRDVGSWRTAREQSSRLRRPPAQAA